jgi:hypothetical protein
MGLAGILKEDKDKFQKLKQQIAVEREVNYV